MNSRRKEALASLTTADWRALVYRELQADQWFVEPMIAQAETTDIQEYDEPESAPLALSANSNGAHLHYANE